MTVTYFVSGVWRHVFIHANDTRLHTGAGSLMSARSPSAGTAVLAALRGCQGWAIRATVRWWTTTPVAPAHRRP